MAVDCKAALLVLEAEVNEVDMSDSDDCLSESEQDRSQDEEGGGGDAGKVENRTTEMEQVVAVMDTGGEGEEIDDYHKMTKIEDRRYQTELLEMAKRMNIIICLPTGSGKTFIALKLAEYMLPDAIEKKQKIVFLANNVPLVHQQAKYFSSNLVNTAVNDDKYVRALSGDLNIDIWKQDQWDEVLNNYHILVMSTQILLDAITKAYVQWSQIALVVLDECHHAQKNHPMAVLMRNYGERLRVKAELPKVLGLTATIIMGKSKEEDIAREIRMIEEMLCSKAVTHHDYETVLKNSTNTTLKVRPFIIDYSSESDDTCQEVHQFIRLLESLPKHIISEDEISSIIDNVDHPTLSSEEQLFNRHKPIQKTLKSFLTDLMRTYNELGPYCCKLATVIKMIFLIQWMQELESSVASDDSDDEENGTISSSSQEDSGIEEAEQFDIRTLLQNTFSVLCSFSLRLDLKMAAVAKRAGHDLKSSEASAVAGEADIVRNCVSNKIRLLWEVLLSRKPNKETIDDDLLCGLVFCERRITAQVLRWYFEKAIKLWPEELGFIKPEVMVGQSGFVHDVEVARFTATKQTNVIRKFHAKELNLLIATQVVEEGLNVPACNLIVRFDSVNTYPSFVQSMGRARQKGAKCYAFIDSSKEIEERKKLNQFLSFSQKLSVALQQNALHVGEDVVVGSFETPIQPFCPSGKPDGAVITSTDAISLVHRYCSALSCDKIASLIPVSWWEEKTDSVGRKVGYRSYVLLPVVSPVQDVVEGEIMPDKTLSKRSAYLEVCKRLYYAGELTENLLPKPRSIENYKCEFLDSLSEEHKAEKATADRKIGTRQRLQWYPKKVPNAFIASHVEPYKPVKVYKIKIRVKGYLGDERASGLHGFENFPNSFGIATTSKLDIPSFSLNANYGEITVSAKSSFVETLTEEQICELEFFQKFMCDFVFGTANPALEVDKCRRLFVVPLYKDGLQTSHVINWSLINRLKLAQDKDLTAVPDIDIRREMKFQPNTFEDALLIPWYKEDKSEPEILCSIKILDGTSALSEFDEPKKYPTFQDYYQKKYDVEIFHSEFPLLLCKSVGKQLNFLTKKVDGKILRKQLRSILRMIPELMNIHPLPASLYVQGRYLPSILHRICRLMVAQEIRLDVASHFNWNVEGQKNEAEVESCQDDSSIEEEFYDAKDFGLGEVKVQPVSPEKEEPSPKKRKKSFINLDDINPLEVSWDVVFDSTTSKKRKGIRDNKFSMPTPPILKSDISKELMDIDKITCLNFDKETDFETEKGPSTETVMEALTLSNAQDNVSLEKLEVMGDSVLKLVVSLHIFRSFSNWDEGKMTLLRMKLISNRHLYLLAKQHNIGELLSGSFFYPAKNWLPVGFTVQQDFENFVLSNQLDYEMFKIHSIQNVKEAEKLIATEDDLKEKQKQSMHTIYTHSRMGDKSMADCMEAIIGAYYIDGGLDGAFRIMEWLGLRGPLKDGSITEYSRESVLAPIEDTDPRRRGKQNIIPLLEDLEEILQYKFKNRWLAVEALTHPTYIGNRITPCYERLEYVGDAILDFLVTNYILKQTNITDPGKITDLRAALVNNVTFGALAVRYGLHSFLKHSSKLLGDFITAFVNFQEDNNHEISDPFKLYSDFDCPTVKEIEVPKVLGDIFESIAGAVFVDSGMSIDTVWKIFYRLMKKELEKFSKNIPKNPLRALYENFPGKVKFRKLQTDETTNPKSNKRSSLSKYQVVTLKVPISDKVVVGLGATVKQAKQAAAKYVMRKISNPVSAFSV